MNKKLILLLLLLIIPLVSAQIQLSKTSFDQKETIQAEIFQENLVQDIKLENIKITDLETNKISTQLNLLKITPSHYYLFFQMNNQGNYLINIENIKYTEYGILKQMSLTQNFEITNNQKQISISPAVFKYKTGISTFPLKIKNNNIQVKTVQLTSNYTSLELPLSATIPGSTEKTINIRLNPEKETNQKITFEIENYIIPIFLPSIQTENIEIFLNNQKITELKKQIKETTTSQAILKIKNNFDEQKQFNLKLTGNLNQILTISKNQLTIEPNKEQTLELNINQQKLPTETQYKGDIQFSIIGFTQNLPIELTISSTLLETSQPLHDAIKQQEEYEPYEPEEPEEQEEEQLEEPQQTKTGLVIGIILIVILIIIIFFFIRKPIKHIKPKYLR